MGSPVRATVRLVLYLSWTFLLIPLQTIALVLRLPLHRRLPRLYHRVCCRLLGLHVLRRGAMVATRPALFISNHTSYLDITVLGSLLDVSFVAKAEIAGWPLFGLLAKLQRSVFIERRASHSRRHRDEVGKRLDQGDALVVFPEGTTGDGNHVLPFKSALFAVAEREVNGEPLLVQPISIAYVRLDGIPLGREWRPYFAWYGAMEMPAHLWTVLGLGQVTVEVHFHHPLDIRSAAIAAGLDWSAPHDRAASAAARKALAESCRTVIAHGVSESIAGVANMSPALPSGHGAAA
ncbi:MAG: lysophospholipid acyltransferase family protein [Gemmatimonas sp.]